VSDNVQKNMLKALLLRSKGKSRLWAALVALCVGTTLLLLSVMIWWNFRELLFGKSQNDTLGSTFLVIGKRVTEQNMGNPTATVFNQQDIDSLKQVPQVEEVGVLISNHFRVYAALSGKLGFATDLFLESVPDKFIDKKPASWGWQPGSTDLPIIISSQFLDLYNYGFAPSQGLPQLSEKSIQNIALDLKVGGDANEHYTAHIVGFSDRISSVLVPETFIKYGNEKYGKGTVEAAPSRLIIKAKDPSDTKFGAYIERHDYTTNSQNLRWSKIRAIVEVVTSATGVLALLLMGIGTLVFILFIELTIARAQNSLTLLQQIGYGPHYLSKFMVQRFMPLVLGTVIFSMAITIIAQVVAAEAVKSQGLVLPLIPGWPVWAALVISTSILAVLVTRSISGAIRKD